MRIDASLLTTAGENGEGDVPDMFGCGAGMNIVDYNFFR